MFHPDDTHFIYSSEEFVKECISLPSNPVVLAITHSSGQIEIEYVPHTLHLVGHVYSFMDDEKEKVIQLDYKNVEREIDSVLALSSVLYSYIAEAYKMANLLDKIIIQSTTYAK